MVKFFAYEVRSDEMPAFEQVQKELPVEVTYCPDPLTEDIENEQIGRLAMDVFDQKDGIYHENLRDSIIKNRSMSYLRQFPNVVMTPHIAFYTAEAVEGMVRGGVAGVYEMLTAGNTKMKLV